MEKWFYERNDKLIADPVNKVFEEILWMSDEEFRDWMKAMRQRVVQIWDDEGIPPRVGFGEVEIIEQFKQMSLFSFIDPHKPNESFVVPDAESGVRDIIRNNRILGNAANQWFPTMMKTKIAYQSNKGLSIYDHFKDDELYEKTVTYGRRHFKRDSFYHYSNPVRSLATDSASKLVDANVLVAPTGKDWVVKFEKEYRQRQTHDYWLQAKDEEESYSGYNQELSTVKWLRITKEQIEALGDIIPEKCKTNLKGLDYTSCHIRVFKLGQKLFPVGLKAFKISWCQYAVNFPPLTAKFLYEEHTNAIKDQEQIVIWDPSSGWGGRILGAMSIDPQRNVHYIGTDPNTDHNTHDGRTKYHELADFFNRHAYRKNGIFQQVNTYEIYQCGAEEMQHEPDFQKYKGKVDLVFTSPPYFCKEIYSNDPEQSCHKFKGYQEWRDKFLYETLKTAVEWLAPERYLLWNIADIALGKEKLPLESDSSKYLESLGMQYVKTWKMALAQMPGGNRIDPETGEPMAKNFCKVLDKGKRNKEIVFKYEPIFVFFKPK